MIALSLPAAADFSSAPDRCDRSRFALNWSRVSGFSSSLAFHTGLAIALLIPPTAMEIRHIVEDPPVYPLTIPLPREVKPAPDMPEPPRHPKRVAKPLTPQITMTAPVPVPVPTAIAPTPSATAPMDAPASADSSGDSKGASDSPPSALSYRNRTQVDYPREALRRREQGTVILRVLVGIDGNPQQIDIDKSSGSHTLDNAAREAVSHWSFSPGIRGGVAYAAWARVPISFNLPQ